MKTDVTMMEELKKAFSHVDGLEADHTFMIDCLTVLADANAAPEEKQATLSIFMSILRMRMGK